MQKRRSFFITRASQNKPLCFHYKDYVNNLMLFRCLINPISLWNQVQTSFDAVILKNLDVVTIYILGGIYILGAIDCIQYTFRLIR